MDAQLLVGCTLGKQFADLLAGIDQQSRLVRFFGVRCWILQLSDKGQFSRS
jgi:hypothetical protein